MVNKKSNRLSILISIFAILIFARALDEFLNLSHYDRYVFLFQHLPRNLILLRYVSSLSIRALFIIAGFGVLFRREVFRKVLLFGCFFSIVTVYWKHPVSVFENVVNDMNKQGLLFSIFKNNPELLVKTLLAWNYVETIVVSIFLIYLFTRPEVKQQFTGKLVRG